ncbi:hypothetical protein BH24PSE2_BH24PSE2_07810 [soil metagenome]
MEGSNRHSSSRGGEPRDRQARYPGGQREEYEDGDDDRSGGRYGSSDAGRSRGSRDRARAGRDTENDHERNIIDRVVQEVRSWFNDQQRGHSRDRGQHEDHPDYGSDYARAYTHRKQYSDYGRSRDFGDDDRQGSRHRRASHDDDWGRSSSHAFVFQEFWLVPGPYQGVGPRGYRRSTDRIKEDICERLAQHGRIDASEIEVDVSDDGEVTLRGTVEKRQIKRLAEDVAESVSGVHDVHNQIRVQRNDVSGRGEDEPSRRGSAAYQEGTTGSTARTEPVTEKQTRTDH